MTAPVYTTTMVAAQAQRVLDEMHTFANVVHQEHGDYLGSVAARSSVANLDQVHCWLEMVADRRVLRLEDDD